MDQLTWAKEHFITLTTEFSIMATHDSASISNNHHKSFDDMDSNETINRNLTQNDIRDENLAIFEIITSGIILILIIFGNLCVLIALFIRKLKMNRMYYFLLHLCVADLITAIFNVLPQLAWDITYRFYGGNVLCKLIKYLQLFGPYLSSYVLVMTAIDRYQAICFPMTNCAWTPNRSKIMIIIAWIISTLFCLPQLFIFSYQIIPSAQIYDCWGTFPQPFGERIYVTWYAVSVFFIPFIILTFTHVCICIEIWKNVHGKRKSIRIEKNKIENRNGQQHFDNQVSRPELLTPTPSSSDSTTQRSTNLLVTVGKSYRFKGRGRIEVTVDGASNEDYQMTNNKNYSPRVHTLNRLSRAKIKTVKITVVIILCYVCCSSPFICVQIWAAWWPQAQLWSSKLLILLFNEI